MFGRNGPKKYHKIPPYKRFKCVLNLVVGSQTIRTLCHEESIDFALKRLVVTVGGLDYYKVYYPTILADHHDLTWYNLEGTPILEALIPVKDVDYVSIQFEARN